MAGETFHTFKTKTILKLQGRHKLPRGRSQQTETHGYCLWGRQNVAVILSVAYHATVGSGHYNPV